MPPFFTWSLRMASAAVVPGAPQCSMPISCMISAMESPTAGVGARDKSTMPNGVPSLDDASFATSCPTRVTLNAVLLIVSQSTSKLCPLTLDMAVRITPGPDTPTLMTFSGSVTPWNAPAMNGLSSVGLQNTTSLAQPTESWPLVATAVSTTFSPISLTASMSIPVRVLARETDEQRRSVEARASGMESKSSLSASVMPFCTRAEYPPMKFTPIFCDALSRDFAISTKSPGVLQQDAPTMATGVTDTLLLMTGIPISRAISSPTDTRSDALSTIRP